MEAANDMNLYAGANANGAVSALDLSLSADAINHTLIPVHTKPSLKNNMTQNNQIVVASDVSAASVRDINLKAGKGDTVIAKSAQTTTLYTGTDTSNNSLTSTITGDTTSGEEYNNSVSNEGKLTAGIHNKLTVNINGSSKTHIEYKDPNAADKEVDEDNSGVDFSDIKDKTTITEGGEWFSIDDMSPAEITLYNSLKEEYDNQIKARDMYPKDSEAYKSLDADAKNLLNQMDKIFVAKDSNGQDTSLSANSVLGVVLPDIVVSGGNIDIETDNLKGSGSLKAQGAPQVNITNSSDLYLKVNDITIKDDGGAIRLNDADISKVNHSFGGSISQDVSNNTPVINITVNSASDLRNTVTTNATDQATIGKLNENNYARPDIEIAGDISNPLGELNITNKNHDIVIDKDAEQTALTVKISADQGSVVQTSTSGINNIGGDPVTMYQFNEDIAGKIQKYMHEQLKDKKKLPSFSSYDDYVIWVMGTADTDIVSKVNAYVAEQKKTNSSYTAPSFTKYDDYVDWLSKTVKVNEYYLKAYRNAYEVYRTQNDPGKEPGGITGGAGVYINGVNVNINGLVQSGYDKYSAVLDGSADTRINDIDKAWNGAPLSDSDVMSNSKYLVNTGGKKWNAAKQCYEYEVGVYYNPSTKKLLVDSINAQGGYISIKGKIASTGNGRLLAMNGTADVDVNTNNITSNLNGITIHSIANKDIKGSIVIDDTLQGKKTTYDNGQSATYNPLEGQRIYYTGGYSGGVIKKYSASKKFLAWGLIKYNSRQDLKNQLKQGNVDIAITSSGSTDGTSLSEEAKGVYVGVDKNLINKGWSVSGSFTETPDPDDSKGVQENKVWGPPGWFGKVAGYGTMNYSWIEANNQSSDTTSSIKADHGIQIGFLGGSSTGDIDITGKHDIELAGNISNAAKRDNAAQAIGGVNITSTGGAISAASNAYIVSDNVNLNADSGIDVNHSAIGTAANITAVTNSGDIGFNSASGDLNIVKMATGGDNPISASTGNVSITAQGSILDASSGTAVKGKRIDLVSKTGTIGTTGKALNIQAGSDVYSSNTMESSVNASAAGDIVLTQANGDMRLGHIESTSGNVVLTASNGSFADATRNSEAGLSDSQDKIDKWLEAGLISNKDDAGANTEAAKAAKEERLAGLEERAKNLAEGNADKIDSYKAAAEAYYADVYSNNDSDIAKAKNTYIAEVKAAKTTDEVNAAYAKYQAAQAKYFEGKGFSADEQDFIASYAEVSKSDNYGWSKNQLLYAISDSVLNSEPGQTVELADKANISAKNITLNAAKGIGVDGDAKEIKSADIMQIDNLKVLAGAKGGDLTWDTKTGDVTVRQQKAITLDVKENGGVTANAVDNVYLATTKDSALKINGNIATSGNVKLMSDAGVELTGEDASVSGKDLIIGGGSGNIGSSGKYFNTNMSGTVDANAGGSIYLHQSGDKVLTMQNAAAGNDIFITADKGMKMSTESGKDMGYLNAANGSVNLIATTGDIGIKGDGMRILNNGAVVNANAENGSVYINGQNGGTMVLGQISGSEFVLTNSTKTAQGTIKNDVTVELGRAAEDGKEAVTGAIAADTVDIDGASLALNGTIKGKKQDKAESVTLRADKNISQADGANSYIDAAALYTKANGAQSLGSTANKVDAIDINSYDDKNTITGDINFVTNAANGLAVSLNGVTVNNGDVKVTNLSDNAAINVNGDITATDADNAGKGNVLFSGQGAFSNSGAVNSAGSYNVEAKGNISQSGAVIAGKDAVLNTTGGSIAAGAISSVQNTSLNAAAGITVNDNVNSGGNVTAVTNSGNIVFNNTATAKNDVTADTKKGDIALNNKVTSSEGNILVQTGEGKVTAAELAAAKDITAKTQKGDIALNNKVTSSSGNIFINAVEGKISAAELADITAVSGSITAKTGTGDIELKGTASAGKGINLTVETSGNITAADKLDAYEDVIVNTKSGSIATNSINAGNNTDLNATAGIAVNGSVTSSGTTSATTGTGGIAFNSDVNSGGDVTAKANTGSIEFKGNVKSTTGGVKAETNDGSIAFDKLVTADTDITAKTNKGDIAFKADITSNKKGINLETASGGITAADGADLKAAEDITAVASGGNVVLKDVTSTGGKVNLETSTSGNIFAGTINAAGDITAKTDKGAITLNNKVTSSEGNILVQTAEGKVTAAELAAAKDITAKTDKGAITLNNKVTSSGGNIFINTVEGSITAANKLDGHENVEVKAEKSGTISLKDVSAAQGSVSAETANGGIAAGHITANQNTSLNATADIAVNGNVISTNGNTTANTANGNITFGGSVISGGNTSAVISGSGDAAFNGAVKSGGDTSAMISGNGSAAFNGAVKSASKVTAETKGIGGITVAKTGGINAGSIGFTTSKGAITIDSDLKSTGESGITLKAGGDKANRADIKFGYGSGKNQIDVNAAKGDINISITKGSVGDITDERSADYENKNLTAANIRAEDGSLTINHDGAGNIDLSQLYAKNNAKVSTADGDLHVGEIDGNLVAVLVKNADKNMKVDNIIAGTQIQVSGSDISLDDITQRVGADNMLNITPTGHAKDKPIDNFTIGNIKTNAGGGVRFDQLWVKNADINVDQGKLHLDKVYVLDKARFSNGHTTATVYGTVPQRNTGDVIYWNNTNVNNPAHDLDRWLDPAVKDNKWMYLHFTEQPNVQESNGLLVYLRDYDYVYNQRFTAENHARWLDGIHSYEVHDTYRNPGLGYFSRYNLYDPLDHSVHPMQNADEDEIEVERI